MICNAYHIYTHALSLSLLAYVLMTFVSSPAILTVVSVPLIPVDVRPCVHPVSDVDGDNTTFVVPSQESNNVFPNMLSPERSQNPQQSRASPPQLPPLAKRIPRPLTFYNETLIDNYRWMHYINDDPDVESYIQAESEYTAAWITQSGVEALQKQLDQEISQIRNSIARQPQRGSLSSESWNDVHSDNLEQQTQEDPSSSHSHSQSDAKKPRVEHLERTQFWDVDGWRYWMDGTVGEYGVFKRRPVPLNAYRRAMEDTQHTYMSSQDVVEPDSDSEIGQQSRLLHSRLFFTLPSGSRDALRDRVKDADEDQRRGGKVTTIGGCSFNSNISASSIEVVLDINRLAKKVKRKGGAGQFSFGTIEIQPKNTSLRHSLDPQVLQDDSSSDDGGWGSKATFAAYTYDTSGEEQYHIRIMPLSSTSSSGSAPATLTSTFSALTLASECERHSSPTEFDFDNWYETQDQGRSIFTQDGKLLKDAGPVTQWVKLGQELFLYFIRLDSKGLSREVWRAKVDSLDATEDGENIPAWRRATKGKPRKRPQYPPKLVPEMVMRENDEANILSVSLTSDGRFLLIEVKLVSQPTTEFFFVHVQLCMFWIMSILSLTSSMPYAIHSNKKK